MNIHVEMTPEEYDDYRAYRKEKKALEEKVYRDLNRLRCYNNDLCKKILTALRTGGSEDNLTVSIVDMKAALRVVETAREWFS